MTRRIFRTAALQRYNDRLEKTVLPRYASPPWASVLWTLCGLLLAFTLLLWSAQTPVYVTGPGVVVLTPAGMRSPNVEDHLQTEVMVAAFLPAASAGQVRVKQRALFQFAGLNANEPDGEAGSEVAVVEPEVLSPAVARARYGLDSSTGLLVEGPVVVALIPLKASASRWLGSVGEVKIAVGSQRGLALLPGIGRFFSEASTP